MKSKNQRVLFTLLFTLCLLIYTHIIYTDVFEEIAGTCSVEPDARSSQ